MQTFSVETDGFEIIEKAVAAETIEALVESICCAVDGLAGAGVRQPHIQDGLIREVASSTKLQGMVGEILGGQARVVRSILFDKTPESNWGVPWHQDLTIAVRERRETPGFLGWSMKNGVHHVQAPREVLDRMLTVRLHLDDCGPENGPLRVLPGTHASGWLDAAAIERARQDIKEQMCLVETGGALLMRPLLLHASSRAREPRHRRVLHLEFAAGDLPGGLEFYAG